VQSAAYALVAMGIVFVLLLGEIDLSVGYVSGVAGVLTALLLLPDGNELPTVVAIILALGAGLAIGTFHGLLITKIGIPSFVVTLAGLLAWNGVVLLLIGSRGTVILQNDFTIGLANDFLEDNIAWLLVIICTALYGAVQFARVRSRHKAGLPAEPMLLPLLRVAGLFAALAIVTAVSNQDRGIPWVLVIVGFFLVWWTFVLRRTKFGRHIYAVGGNIEAARRAGISTDRIKIACFALCSFMAAVGGIVLASRLRSVDTNAGGGSILLYSIAAAVIGGTSLFGGRGHMKSAVLGALVIGSIDNGLGLLGLSSGTKFVVTGAVLLLAVAVDSISRKGRASSGRA
jgi:D-xylose transport system permease protein